MSLRPCAPHGRFAALVLLAAWCVVASAETEQPIQTYRIDAAASSIHWRVYKAGALSRLGHNHVISVGELSGIVTRDPSGASSFELTLPVTDLVVDDPVLRSRLGGSFSSEPSAKDIAGTRRNMLGKKVLDAEHYSVIRVTGTASGATGSSELAVTAELLGRSVAFTAPCHLTETDGTLTAAGEFSLTHADLGLKRFSVMLGTLAVAESLDFSYRVQAVRAERQPPAAGAPMF